jgi:hypothetical protein
LTASQTRTANGDRRASVTLVKPLSPQLEPYCGPAPTPRPPVRDRLQRAAFLLWERHRVSAVWLFPLLALAGVLHGWNMHHAPGPNDDEATYVSQAWAVQEHGQLSHYTYWYDHPPLGWLLLTAWNMLFLVIPSHANLLYAGRDAMLFVHLCSCLLLFVLVRRLGMARWVGACTVVAFTVSPLGMAWSRLVMLDNIGTPLVLLALVLALSPRHRLTAFAGSGAAVAAAVLVKETNALFVPAVAYQLWLATSSRDRRFPVMVFAGVFLGVVGLYPLYAALKDELFPGPGHVSLLWALDWQLFSRPASGSALQPGSDTQMAIESWLQTDKWMLLGAVAAGPLVWWRQPMARPLVLAMLVLCVMPLRGGYLPAPYPINLLWPAAMLCGCLLHVLTGPFRTVGGRSRAGRLTRVIGTTAVAAAAMTPIVINSYHHDEPYLTSDQDREYRQAKSWVTEHLPRDAVIVTDNTMWIDLIQDGYRRVDVIWFYKLDLDPAVRRDHPGGWRAVDYVVESGIVGATDHDLPDVRRAIAHGTVVADFGEIHIYRIHHHPQRTQDPEGGGHRTTPRAGANGR